MATTLTDALPNGLAQVEQDIARACREARRERASVTLIAVSKTFEATAISPVIDAGQRVFGENRVQEAKAKWPALVSACPGIALHLIGPLQSNKAKEAVALFDAIHSVDRPSICEALAKEINSQNSAAGIVRPTAIPARNRRRPASRSARPTPSSQAAATNMALVISGLMCIPPVNEAPGAAFRADRQDRRAQRVEKSVDGHERRFRGQRSSSAPRMCA